MRTETKYRLILTFGFLCLIGFAAQTIQLWRITDQLVQMDSAKDEIPASIEQRLLAQMDKDKATRNSNSGLAMGSPFARLDQIQNYMDSVFAGFGTSPLASNNLFSQSRMSLSNTLPEIEINETEQHYQIVIPVNREQEIELNTTIEDNAFSLTGVITENVQQSQNAFASSFVSQRQFAKTFELPHPVNEFAMTTEQTNDGIEILLPKKNS